MGLILASTSFPSLFFITWKQTEPVSRILYEWCELQAIDNVLTSQNMLHDCFSLLYTVLFNIRINSRSPSSVIAHIKLVALHGLMLIYVWFKISLIKILCSVYSHNAASVICQQLHGYYHMSFFTHVFHSSYMFWLYVAILRYIMCCKLFHCNPYWGKHKLKLIES